MRKLFEIDAHNYKPNSPRTYRPSYRAIVIEKDKIHLVHSQKYNYYKFPGGGKDDGESPTDAVVREAREEAGLIVDPTTVRDFGYVRRISASFEGGIFDQMNYYYLCDATSGGEQCLDDYESDEGFTPVLISPAVAIATNRCHNPAAGRETMREREAKVLEILINEGYFSKE